MPNGTVKHWEHPSSQLVGVSNDKALAFFVCAVCGYDWMGLNMPDACGVVQ